MHTLYLHPNTRQRSTKERVSVNNFVATINDQVVGILNERMFEKGLTRIGPIWGGARIVNKKILLDLWAKDIERNDARFTIQRIQRKVFLDLLITPNKDIVETDIRRELFEELSNVVYDTEEELYPLLSASRNMAPVISPQTLEEWLLYTAYLDTLAYRRPSQHHAPMMSNYIWYLHEVYVTHKVFSELISSGHVVIITPDHIAEGHTKLQPLLPSMQAIYERVQQKSRV
jgi:hypothetical protein